MLQEQNQILNASRLRWTDEETKLIKLLKESMGQCSWGTIAKQLNINFPQKQRNAKQCREQYINAGRFSEPRGNWTDQECKTLIQMFQAYGPKWIVISRELNGRSENCVKNKFYGSLRKLIRRVNDAMRNYFKQNQIKLKKPIKFQSVMKIFEISNYGSQLVKLESRLDQIQTLKRDLLNQVASRIESISQQNLVALAQRIYEFNCSTRFLGATRNKISNNFKKQSKTRSKCLKIKKDVPETSTINSCQQNKQVVSSGSDDLIFEKITDLQLQKKKLDSFQKTQQIPPQFFPQEKNLEEEKQNFINKIFDNPIDDIYYLLLG